MITTGKNETHQGHCTPVGCRPTLQKGDGLCEVWKEAVKENEAVMSSPGAREVGGGTGQEFIHQRERKRQARLVPW